MSLLLLWETLSSAFIDKFEHAFSVFMVMILRSGSSHCISSSNASYRLSLVLAVYFEGNSESFLSILSMRNIQPELICKNVVLKNFKKFLQKTPVADGLFQ